jgi:hypothetical protein
MYVLPKDILFRETIQQWGDRTRRQMSCSENKVVEIGNFFVFSLSKLVDAQNRAVSSNSRYAWRGDRDRWITGLQSPVNVSQRIPAVPPPEKY